MSGWIVRSGFAVALLARPAAAHPEHCGQSSYLTVARDRVRLELEQSPGPAVAARLASLIDRDVDWTISEAEKQAYAREAMGQQELRLDGEPVRWRLMQAEVPEATLLASGQAKIRMVFEAPAALSPGDHTMTLVNHHEPVVSSYMAHAFVSPGVTLGKQTRDTPMRTLLVALKVDGPPPMSRGERWALGLGVMGAAVSLLQSARRARRRAG